MKKTVLAFILCLFFATQGVGQVSVLQCHDMGWITSLNEAYLNLYSINDQIKTYSGCGGGSNLFKSQIIVAVIDPSNCEPWCTPDDTDPFGGPDVCTQNDFGQLNGSCECCGWSVSRPAFYWNQQDSTSMDSLADFLLNDIPDSMYILIYTWLINPNNVYGAPVSGSFAPWSPTSLNSFHNIGFNQIDTIPLNHPWIFFTKKGDLSSVQTVIGTHPQDTLDFSTLICTNEPFVFASDVTVCQNDSVTIAGHSEALNYLWSTGDTTQSITVNDEGYYVLTAQLDSVYNHSDSTYSPFYYTDSIFIDTVSCTGIEEFENSFSLYPNPAKESITISFNRKPERSTMLSIYTLYGTLKKEILIPANAGNIEIPLSGFSPGVYHLSIKTGANISSSKKVVVY